MTQIDGHPAEASAPVRLIRLVVPWVLLLIVAAVLWTFVADYRAAQDAVDATRSTETTQQAGVDVAGPYVVVLSDGLNLRAGASTGSAVVQVLAIDQQLTLVEEGTGWYHVRTADGVEGWVAAGGQYTQLVEP